MGEGFREKVGVDEAVVQLLLDEDRGVRDGARALERTVESSEIGPSLDTHELYLESDGGLERAVEAALESSSG